MTPSEIAAGLTKDQADVLSRLTDGRFARLTNAERRDCEALAKFGLCRIVDEDQSAWRVYHSDEQWRSCLAVRNILLSQDER